MLPRPKFLFKVRPITQAKAKQYVNSIHRHLSAPNGWRFGAALDADGVIIGVVFASHPTSRMQDDGMTIEIIRLAVIDMPDAKNGCSMLYGAICRAAFALGFTRVITYTRLDEPGTSLRAAGFELDGQTDGGEWDRPSRSRRAAEQPEPKNRWVRYAPRVRPRA